MKRLHNNMQIFPGISHRKRLPDSHKKNQTAGFTFSNQIVLHILRLKIEDTPLIGVDDMGVFIFIVSLVLQAVIHMHMPVEKKLRLIFFHEVDKSLEALVGKIPPVV